MDEAYERRAAERRATMTAIVVRSPQALAAVKAENIRRIEPHRRAELIWPLVCELAAIQGVDERQLQFDRSVARLERRRR
jgi:hypothetical protein